MSGTTSGVEFTRSGEDIHMRIFRGTTIGFEVIWGGSAPIDITGYQASMQIRDFKDNLVLEFSTANGRITVGGTNGKFTFSGSPSDSRAVTAVGKWELELTAPNGDVYRALSGVATPVEEIVI